MQKIVDSKGVPHLYLFSIREINISEIIFYFYSEELPWHEKIN